MQLPRTKIGLLKYVETLHMALEREIVAPFNEDTIPQLKSYIKRMENVLDRVPNGEELKKQALANALSMPDEHSLLAKRR